MYFISIIFIKYKFKVALKSANKKDKTTT